MQGSNKPKNKNYKSKKSDNSKHELYQKVTTAKQSKNSTKTTAKKSVKKEVQRPKSPLKILLF